MNFFLPLPDRIGLPSKFKDWRLDQDQAVLRSIDSDKRFVAHAMSTGGGKSLVYMAQALLTGARTCILTSTKALQNQLTHDFRNLVDIRGQGNYQCLALTEQGEFSHLLGSNKWHGCDEGPCHYEDHKCSLKDKGCLYFDALRRAKSAKIVVTNYAYWMAINNYGEGLGHFDLLILDEAHSVAVDELPSFLKIVIGKEEIRKLITGATIPENENLEDWKHWALTVISELNKKEQHRNVRKIRENLFKLSTAKGEWVIEDTGNTVLFDVISPHHYAEPMLFRSIPKVVLFSATIRPKTCELLGIDSVDFYEYNSTFPVRNRPIIYLPTIKLQKNNSSHELWEWVRRIDRIIDGRLDRNGIIHTISYERARFLKEYSIHRDIIITHNSGGVHQAVKKFKQSDPPVILVSPCVTTGYDFPGDECRYQVISKLPFLDTRAKIFQARKQKDKNYTYYLVAQELVQMCGRAVRSIEDWSENFILDSHWGWFWIKYKDYFPKWFLEACRKDNVIPLAPKV